jgi:2-aminobenzoate-CoA ligase
MNAGVVDTYVQDNLPLPEVLPSIGWFGHEPKSYPEQLNCVAEFLDKALSEGHGARPALRWPGGSCTYRELHDQVNRCANVLVHDFGVVPGERVLLRATNHPLLVTAWLAILKAGAVAVTTMPLLRAHELTHILETARVNLALCDADLMGELSEAVARVQYAPRASAALRAGSSDSIESKMARASPDFVPHLTSADHPAIIAFTSGTTGSAKAAVHVHRDLMVVGDVVLGSIVDARPDDVFVSTAALAFTFGLGALILFPFRARASALLIERPNVDELLTAVQEHQATILFTGPTMYRRLARVIQSLPKNPLRTCVSAGEHLPPAVYDEWLALTGLRLINGLGTTEMLHIFLSAEPAGTVSGSTGKPLPGYEVRVVDADGNNVAPGVPGRLAVRGPTGCRYLANVARQREYVRAGWNFTGDIFVVDSDGYYWFRGRADDLIISAGHNIAGVEVENVLLSHPKVSECAVVGIPDDERGQVVKAVVVLSDSRDASSETVAELQRHVKHNLAPYKYPRRVEFVAQLPKTSTGKVQRSKLRDAEIGPPPHSVESP